MDKVLCLEFLEMDPSNGKALKEWRHWKWTFDNFLDVLHKETWTSSRLGRITCLLQSLKTSRSASTMKQLGGYFKHFCESLKWNLCRPWGANNLAKCCMNTFKLWNHLARISTSKVSLLNNYPAKSRGISPDT